MKLSDLYNEERELAVKIDDGEPLVVRYRPGAVTAGSLLGLDKIKTNIDVAGELVARLDKALISWDLTEDGHELPVNETTLQLLPMKVLREIYSAIISDATLGEAKGATSAAG